jgi:hypothetical protein
MGAMATAKREGLARRAAGNQPNAASVFTKLDFPHIASKKIPCAHRINATSLVLSNCVAAIAVAFYDLDGMKPGLMKADSEPPAPANNSIDFMATPETILFDAPASADRAVRTPTPPSIPSHRP